MSAENKTLKFEAELVPLVLSGEKDSTWRFWDDKNLTEGDIIVLIRRPELIPFAKAKITSVIEKPVGQLTEDDKKGHKKFSSDEEMYRTYTRYSNKPVTAETLVKIVRFTLLKA